MKFARIALPVVALAFIFTSSAAAQEGAKGRTLLHMIDTIYGDFSKCASVPEAASSREKEKKLLVPVISLMRDSYDSEKTRIASETQEQGKKVLLQTAFGICYFILSLLISIALSSIFLWLGATIAGLKGKTFITALICSSFDRVIVSLVLVGIAFLLGAVVKDNSLMAGAMKFIVPVVLVIFLFFISTVISRYVYGTTMGKAFLIQLCARVAVGLVAVFILGFASAASLVT